MILTLARNSDYPHGEDTVPVKGYDEHDEFLTRQN